MVPDLPRPAIFAHRGASAYAPENTLASFELAVSQKSDAIELDVKLTADGHVVVIHDSTVDRTTDGQGRVSQMTLEQLKALDAGQKFDDVFRGERIPTLGEVFQAVQHRVLINIELTNYESPRDTLPEKVADILLAHHQETNVLISSFNPIALRRFHNILPDCPLGLLALPGLAGAWARSALGRWVPYQALHPALRDTTPTLIRQRHRLGHRVHTYTVNLPADMQKLFRWEVDGIFTDDPPLAQRTLAHFRNHDKEQHDPL